MWRVIKSLIIYGVTFPPHFLIIIIIFQILASNESAHLLPILSTSKYTHFLFFFILLSKYALGLRVIGMCRCSPRRGWRRHSGPRPRSTAPSPAWAGTTTSLPGDKSHWLDLQSIGTSLDFFRTVPLTQIQLWNNCFYLCAFDLEFGPRLVNYW